MQRLLHGVDRLADGKIADSDTVVPYHGVERHAPMLFAAFEDGFDGRKARCGSVFGRQFECSPEPSQ